MYLYKGENCIFVLKFTLTKDLPASPQTVEDNINQGLVILMIDEGLPSDQVENTLPNSSDEENNRDQEFSQARQSKSPRKSPLAKKKKRQPKLVALKPLKFAEMHKRAKV